METVSKDESAKSPGMTLKSQFAYERFGWSWKSIVRIIRKNRNLQGDLLQLGYKKGDTRKYLSPPIKECIIKHIELL
jgi:hypothetical protein